MSHKLIQLNVLKPVVLSAPTLFATKDISEHPRILAAYPELVGHRNYHAFIGRALSVHHVALGIEKFRDKPPRGMQWKKRSP